MSRIKFLLKLMSSKFHPFSNLCIFGVSLGYLSFPSICLDLNLKKKKKLMRISYVQHIKLIPTRFKRAIHFKFRTDCYFFLISCFAVYAVLCVCMAGCKITPLCTWLSVCAQVALCIHAPCMCTASCIRGSV